jgi:hypothetical protein
LKASHDALGRLEDRFALCKTLVFVAKVVEHVITLVAVSDMAVALVLIRSVSCMMVEFVRRMPPDQ